MSRPVDPILTTMNSQSMAPSQISYGLLGFISAVVAYQVPALIVANIIAATGDIELIRASDLIQIAVGILLSVIAYSLVSNRSLKFGMRVCYGLVTGALFGIGAYTILTSL